MSIIDTIADRFGYSKKTAHPVALPETFEKAEERESYAANPLALTFQKLNSQYGLKRPSQITNQTLRRMSRANWVDRACITTLRDEITSIPWDIVPKDPKEDFDEKFKEYLIELLNNPNRNRENWRTLIDKVMEDILVLDAGTIEKVRDGRGQITELWHVDGGTILPQYDEHGIIGDTAYQQFMPDLQGTVQIESNKPVAEFSNNDLIYIMWNPQGAVDTFGYGQSPVESGLAVGTAFLYAEAYNLGFFRNNTIPPVLINMGKDVPQRDVEQFRSFLASEIAGEGGWHSPIVGSFNEGWDIKEVLKSPTDMAWSSYVEWQMKWKVALYRMSPQDIGFNVDMYKVEGQVQQEISKNKAIDSLKNVLAEYIGKEIIGDKGFKGFNENLRFEWIDPETVDPLKQAQIDEIYLKNGVVNINKIRQDQGLDPIVGGTKPLLQLGSTMVPLDGDILEEGEEVETEKSLSKSFSAEDAKKIGDALKIDWKNVDIKEFIMGVNEELEHRDVTGGDPIKTGKIVLAHLAEDPKYYTKLKIAMEKNFNPTEGSIVSLADNATAVCWMDDRGVTQPLFVTDFGKDKGFTVKPSFLDDKREQEPPEQKVADVMRLLKVNTPEVKIMSYDDVIKLIPTERMSEFSKWISLEPPFNSQEWRQRWGDTRKAAYYIVTGFINGRDLNNQDLRNSMKASPDSYVGAINDLAKVWLVENKFKLGDRKPGHYIVTKDGNGFGVDYQFYQTPESWEKTKKYLPESLKEINPSLRECWDKAIRDNAAEYGLLEKSIPKPTNWEAETVLTDMEKSLSKVLQKKIWAWYQKASGIKADKRPLVRKALEFNPRESYITNGSYVWQNNVKYPLDVIDKSKIPTVDDLKLTIKDYKPFFDYGVDKAQLDIKPHFQKADPANPDPIRVNNPDLYAPMFDKRINYLANTMNDSMKKAVDDAIVNGIDNGLTYGEMADAIQSTLGVDPDDPDFPDYRAERVARTESMWAINEGMREQYQEIGINKVNVDAAPDCCDDCDDIVSGNPYDLSEAEDLLPAHPSCRCVLTGDFTDLLAD